MTSASQAGPEQEAQQTQVQQLLAWLFPILGGFAILEGTAFAMFGDLWMGLLALATCGFIGLLLLARGWMLAGRMRSAVILIAVSTWMIDIIAVLIQPAIRPTLAVAPLVCVALVLPYFQGTALRRLLYATWCVTVLVAIIGEPIERSSAAPMWILSLLRVGSLATALALILLLLWHFSNQLRTTLTGTQTAYTALQEHDARLRAVIANVPVVLFTVDTNGIFTLSEGKALAALGLDPGAIVGQSVFDSNAMFPEGLALFRRALNGESASWSGAVGERHYEAHLTPFHDADGQLRGVIGVAFDITARARAEAERRAAEAKLWAVINSVPIILYAVDRDGTFIFGAGKGLDALGLGPGEWVGRSVFETYRDRPQVLELVRRAQAGEIVNSTVEVAGVVFEIWLSPQYDETGAVGGHLGVALDITERKRLEAQLLQAQKLESIGRLAGGIAHDFNNLLTAIVGNAELALDSLPAHAPAATDIHEIQASAQRAATLTRQLLAFARKQPLATRVLSLNDLIRNVESMLRRLIGENIVLVNYHAPDLWPVRVDPSQIEQVLVNLAVNARDAMPAGGTLTIATTNVTVNRISTPYPDSPPGAFVRVSISDTGTGMPPSVLAHTFEPFFTTKDPGKGTGLGLATSYGIVTQHGGSIAIASVVGQGTTVTLDLPRATEPVSEAGVVDSEADLPRGSETVLLVEDEPAVRALAARVLRQQGYTVLEAGDGLEALRVADARAPGELHVLITDIVMPHMGGLALAEQMARRYPHIKVLLISGYTDEAIDHRAPSGGTRKYIQKPFTRASLSRAVREALDA